MIKIVINTFILFLMFSLLGCGRFLDDAPPENTLLKNENRVEVNEEKLAKIFDEDVSSELDKIHNRLKQFRKSVRSVREGYLSRANLERVIDQLKIKNPAKTKKGLGVLFAINALLFGGDKEYISSVNLDHLFEFLKDLNRKYVTFLKPAFDAEKSTLRQHNVYRTRIYKIVNELTRNLDKLANLSSKQKEDDTYRVHILDELVSKLEKDEKDPDKNFTMSETVKTFLFVKRMLLGGDKNYITTKGIYRFLDMLPSLAVNIYDIMKAPDLWYGDSKEDVTGNEKNEFIKFSLLDSALTKIRAKFYGFENKSEKVFEFEDIANLSKYFYDNFEKEKAKGNKEGVENPLIDLTEHSEEITEIKNKFLGSGRNEKEFTVHNVDVIFDRVHALLARLRYFYQIYEYVDLKDNSLDYAKYLNSSVKFDNRDDDENNHVLITALKKHPTNTIEEIQFKKEFIEVVVNYKYFHSQKMELKTVTRDIDGVLKRITKNVDVPKYHQGYKRNKAGVAMIGALQYVSRLAFEVYGIPVEKLHEEYDRQCNDELKWCEINASKTIIKQCKNHCRGLISRDDRKTCRAECKDTKKYCKKLADNERGYCKQKIEYTDTKNIGSFNFGYVLTAERLKELLDKFSRILKKKDMLNPVSTTDQAKSMRLTCDLFQHQSNGDGLIGVNEFVEYFSTGLVGTKFVEPAYNEFSMICKDDQNSKGDPSEACVDRNFWSNFSEKENLAPGLFEFINNSTNDLKENEKFKCRYLERIKLFALDKCNVTGDCDYPYMSKRDFLLLYGAFLNVESVMVRFDKSDEKGVYDNYLDYHELQIAFKEVFKHEIHIFKPEIKESWNKIALAGMLWLVDYGSMPENDLEIIPYAYLHNKKEIEGTRMAVANVLAFLADSNFDPEKVDKKCQ